MDLLNLKNDPVAFIEAVFPIRLWYKQCEIANSVVTHRMTVVRAAHAQGKSFLFALLALWWLYTREDSIVVTTAPTNRQVKEVLWRDLRKAYSSARVPLGGKLMPQNCKLDIGQKHYAVGFSTDKADRMNGFHCTGGVLFLIDEAGGINSETWEAILGCSTGANDRIAAIGNPTSKNCEFFGKFGIPSVATHVMSAIDCPNVRDGRELIPGMATAEWVEQCRENWGEDSPIYRSRVLAEFPDEGENVIAPLSWIDAAVERWRERGDDWGPAHVQIGMDIARTGMDSSMLATHYIDEGIRGIHIIPHGLTDETLGHLMHFVRTFGDLATLQRVVIDADGVGGGVYDHGRHELEDLDIDAVAFMGGSKPVISDPTQTLVFANRRAEAYWTLRKLLEPPTTFCIPPDPKLASQLSSLRWFTNRSSKIQIQSKDEYKKENKNRSPDEADAAAYAVCPVSLANSWVMV